MSTASVNPAQRTPPAPEDWARRSVPSHPRPGGHGGRPAVRRRRVHHHHDPGDRRRGRGGRASVYYAFGTKPAILAAALDLAVAGDTEPVATLDRDWVRHALDAPDPADQLRGQVDGAGEILARVAPLLDVVRGAAATDPDLAATWRTSIEQRRAVQRVFAATLARKTPLRAGIGVEDAADTALAVLGPESYTLLTVHCGWSDRRWRAWALDALLRQLTELPTPPR